MKTAGDILNANQQEMICVTEKTTIHEALERMVPQNIGAVLVKRDEEIVGIWTERDLTRNVILPGFDPKTARIGYYMTKNLHTAPFDTPLIKLNEMFLGLYKYQRYRSLFLGHLRQLLALA